MQQFGRSPFDDPSGLCNHLLPTADAVYDIGSSTKRIRNFYVEGSVIGATFDLANNQWLQSRNAADSAFLKLLKADTSNNTVLNALTGKVINLEVNEVSKAQVSASALTLQTGVALNLADGSDKNYEVGVTAAGTAYVLTNTAAALDFGTTDPSLVINKAGTYLLLARFNLKYNGATFAAARTVTMKLRRTNNTPADLTGGTTVLTTDIITTKTFTFVAGGLPAVIYTTTNVDDAITIFGDVNTVPTAGSLDAVEANIVAVRLF